MEKLQFEAPVEPLSAEDQSRVDVLEHGIAVLDLFSLEVSEEERRNSFIAKTEPGKASREEILQGPSYRGNEVKLNLAINRARRGYKVNRIRRQAMYEHALYLGMEADIKKGKVVVPRQEDWKVLSLEHAMWRTKFATYQRNDTRDIYRHTLRSRMLAITGGNVILQPGPNVSLEERAIRLTRAVNAMARRSMLSGLGIGMADPQYNEAIEKRYEEKTPNVDAASIRKRDRLLKIAKVDFWQASGFPELRTSGLMSEALLRRRAQKMWGEFAGQYEHSPQQEERVELRDQLSGYIPLNRFNETIIR